MARSFYKLVFGPVTLAAGTANTAQCKLDAGRDFIVEGMSHTVYSGTAGVTMANRPLPLLTVMPRPAAAEAGFWNAPAPLDSVSGDGREPCLLSMPVVLSGNTTPVMELANLSSDTAYTVFVVLHGYREDNK